MHAHACLLFFSCSGNVVNKRRNQEVQISHLMKRLIYCSQPLDSRVSSSRLNTLYFNFYPQKMTICLTIAGLIINNVRRCAFGQEVTYNV